jgi:hypothetical protein
MLTWDNAAVALAVVAVLLRLLDYPRVATITSSLSVVAATLGQWVAHQARQDQIRLRF